MEFFNKKDDLINLEFKNEENKDTTRTKNGNRKKIISFSIIGAILIGAGYFAYKNFSPIEGGGSINYDDNDKNNSHYYFNISSKKEDKNRTATVIIDKTKLNIPDKVKVQKSDKELKIVFKTEEPKEVKELKQQIKALIQEVNTLKNSSKKGFDKYISSLQKELLNKINSIKDEFKTAISSLNNKIEKNSERASLNEKKISELQREYNESLQQIEALASDIKTLKSSLKNVDKDTIERLKSLVEEINKKTQDFQKLNIQMSKIKKIFQDNIKANIELAKKIESFQKQLNLLQERVNRITKTKVTAIKNAQNNNTANTKELSKKDYINAFGFYYAGYSESEGKAIGYISDASGKIYEIRLGDIINDKYKVIEIKPLYIKLKDLENNKNYIISYKQ